ncbi:hypothetical protein BSKO_02526 [Bryopsis sp. KO-2023]|nr:hypothetical protein BSKO_02526 [Bryopsis sp. KO-2023]
MHIWSSPGLSSKPVQCVISKVEASAAMSTLGSHLLVRKSMAFGVIKLVDKKAKLMFQHIVGRDDNVPVVVTKEALPKREELRLIEPNPQLITDFWPHELLPTSTSPLRMLASRKNLADGVTVGGLTVTPHIRRELLEMMKKTVARILLHRKNQLGVFGGVTRFSIGYRTLAKRITHRSCAR